MRTAGPITQRDVEAIVAAVIKMYDDKLAQAVAMIDELAAEVSRLTKENAEYRADLSGKDDIIDKLYAEINTLQKEVERANEARRDLGIV